MAQSLSLTMSHITKNIAGIQHRILSACQLAQRNPSEIKILLATKTVTPENIKIALQNGITRIGENKVQELKSKFEALKDIPHESHFIGHLQSNKIKEVIQYAQCIQSVDRWSLAQKLQNRLEYEDKNIDVFIQVNTSNEASKFGIEPEKAVELAMQMKSLNRIRIKGLMTIGLFSPIPELTRPCFKQLKHIQRELLDLDIPVHDLSMGMSNDLETAIEEGSTMIRVGTAVFGKRALPDSYYWNESK